MITDIIRAVRVFLLQGRVRYLQATLANIPITHAEWAVVFFEVKQAEARLWAAWDA